MKSKLLVAGFLLANVNVLFGEQSFIDFEDRLHPAIKTITEIVIPEFPCAFNGTIFSYNDHILYCFRERDKNLKSTFGMGCVYLDKNFKPISKPHIIQWKDPNPSSFEQTQDPRLFVVAGKLYIIFSNFYSFEGITARRMFVAQLTEENEMFSIEKPVCMQAPERLSKRWEKNWVPIVHNDELYLAYTLEPHYVLKPNIKTGQIEEAFLSSGDINWQWGELRGGTAAFLDHDKYIAFFHSSLLLKSVHSKGKKIQHYVMGAYLFESKLPFHLTAISPEPIVGKGFYCGKPYPTWKPLHVVFPMGLIVGEDSLWVSYGRQDFETWVVEFDKQKLYASLEPIGNSSKKRVFKSVVNNIRE